MLLLLFRARKNRQPSLCTSKTSNKELGWFDQSDGGRINDGFFFFFF